jgi:flagellar FliL protein
MILPFSGGSAEAEEPHPGETVALEAIAVNLAGGRFLKTGVTLQLTEDAVELSDPAGSKALDLVISQFSQAQRVDVTGARDALKSRAAPAGESRSGLKMVRGRP